MAEVISMANFNATKAELAQTEIRNLLAESWRLINVMPGLPTVIEREQAVIRSTELKMKAHAVAKTIGVQIQEGKDGVFLLARVVQEID